MDGRDLVGALGPVPVREDVRHRQLGPPAGLVNVETIFAEAAQIEDAEVGAA